MSKNSFETAGANAESAFDVIAAILRLNRLGYSVEFQPTISPLGGAMSGSIVFNKLTITGSLVEGWMPLTSHESPGQVSYTLQKQIYKLRKGIPPENLHWRIDLFDPGTVAAAIHRFCELFEQQILDSNAPDELPDDDDLIDPA